MSSDTDPSELSPDPEETPLESPFSLKWVSFKLNRIEAAVQNVATNQIAVLTRMDRFARALENIAQRVTALEVSRQRAPLLLSSLALAVALWVAFQVHR